MLPIPNLRVVSTGLNLEGAPKISGEEQDLLTCTGGVIVGGGSAGFIGEIKARNCAVWDH